MKWGVTKLWGFTRFGEYQTPLAILFPFCFSNTVSQQINSYCQFQSALLCRNYSQGARSAFETPLLSAEWSHWSVTSSRRRTWAAGRILCQSVPLESSPFPPSLPKSQRESHQNQARRKHLCLAQNEGHKEDGGGERKLVLAGHGFAALKRK